MNSNEQQVKAVDELIEKAKAWVIKQFEPNGVTTKRSWLDASPKDSYGNSEYRVTILVLEGSPPKGYILASYSGGIVKAFDAWFGGRSWNCNSIRF